MDDIYICDASLVEEGGTPRAWTLTTTLNEIRGHEDQANGSRWKDVDWRRNFGGENWLDRREHARAYARRDPDVTETSTLESARLLLEHGAEKVARGITTAVEVLSVTAEDLR